MEGSRFWASLGGSWLPPRSGWETDEGAKSWASLGGSWLPPWSGWETEEGHFNKTAKTLSPVSRTLPRGRATGASLGGSWLPPRSGWETEEGHFSNQCFTPNQQRHSPPLLEVNIRSFVDQNEGTFHSLRRLSIASKSCGVVKRTPFRPLCFGYKLPENWRPDGQKPFTVWRP
jgi:hypothetical protein